MSIEVKLRRRSVAEQRDIYQMRLVDAIAGLQQIKNGWHIGCAKGRRGDLKLMGPNGEVDLSASCPACIAEKTLERVAHSGA